MSESSPVPAQVLAVFREVLMQPRLELTHATTAGEVSGWDSLSHIQILVAIEKAYDVRFSAAEIAQLQHVGALCDLLAAKKSS